MLVTSLIYACNWYNRYRALWILTSSWIN